MAAGKRERKSSNDKKNNSMPVVSLKLRNALLVAGVLAIVVFTFVQLHPQGIASALGMMDMTGRDSSYWKNLNLRLSAVPTSDFKPGENAPGVSIKSESVSVLGINVFYKTAEPADGVTPTGQVLFLLHGAAFQAKTWQIEVPTIQTMASVGHKVIAVDLPGYGQTVRYSEDKGEFLETMIKTLSKVNVDGEKTFVRPVLVSPSMSGSFSLPLLDRNQDLLCGYVTVAPVATSSYQPSFYQAIHVPTMIVYGENDRGLGVTSAQHLSVIPSSTLPQILPNARHPAYLDEPAHWHQLLYNFMLHLIC